MHRHIVWGTFDIGKPESEDREFAALDDQFVEMEGKAAPRFFLRRKFQLAGVGKIQKNLRPGNPHLLHVAANEVLVSPVEGHRLGLHRVAEPDMVEHEGLRGLPVDVLNLEDAVGIQAPEPAHEDRARTPDQNGQRANEKQSAQHEAQKNRAPEVFAGNPHSAKIEDKFQLASQSCQPSAISFQLGKRS